MTTELQRYNCFARNGGNSVPKHVSQEAKGINPTAGLNLLWVRNPFRGNFDHWQVSRKETGQIFLLFKYDVINPCFFSFFDYVPLKCKGTMSLPQWRYNSTHFKLDSRSMRLVRPALR